MGCNDKSIEELIIPDNVKAINHEAFSGCSSLKTVTIPKSLISLGGHAFYGCESLTSVNIEDLKAWCRVNHNNPASNPLLYAGNLYLNGSLVTNLEIPAGVKRLKYNIFRGCTSITSVKIPEGVSSIESSVFGDCPNLRIAYIPDSVTTIDKNAFTHVSTNVGQGKLSFEFEIKNGFTIVCNEGSYAAQYASEYGIPVKYNNQSKNGTLKENLSIIEAIRYLNNK